MKALTFAQGKWVEGNPKLIGPMTHGLWLSSSVFDGARYFDGVMPDLDRHCARVVNSARVIGLEPAITGPEIEEIVREGIRKLPKDMALYICPMFYADAGFIIPDPDSTQFVLSLYEKPMLEPDGFTAIYSSYRRPAADQAPTEAKASCLYPNVSRCVAEAKAMGCDTAVVRDPDGNVAEFAYTNLFMVKDGAVHTPAINGTFLNGITRQRTIALLREDGHEVLERTIKPEELATAEEVFATGNVFKVQPCIRIAETDYEIGPVFKKARELYMDFALSAKK